MQISKEPRDSHSIQAYEDKAVKINNTLYDDNLIVSKGKIIEHWSIESLSQLDETHLQTILELKPEIVLIGHNNIGMQPPIAILEQLSKNKIGFEAMSVGAACRTFNILLSEERRVVLGIIF